MIESCKCGRDLIGNNPKICISCGMIPIDCECSHLEPVEWDV